MNSEVQEEIPMHEEFILCGGTETQVVKCGPWTNLLDEQSVNRPKLLVFVIPGNPGFSTFYVPFAKALHSLTNRCFPVWAVTHAGFALLPKDKKILTTPQDSNAQDIKDIYGLSGQIEHKIAFLRTHVPKDMKLMLIGHSIGCYIALQIMKRAPDLQVVHTFLLFPTIERMSESPNGRIATPLLCWFRYALYATSYLLLKPCPDTIKSFLIRITLQMMNFKTEFSLMNLVQPFCLANAAYLGAQEMMQVVKRDDEIIKEHLSKANFLARSGDFVPSTGQSSMTDRDCPFQEQLTFYYGKTDGWCPVKYYEDIKKDFPEGDIRLCEQGIPHAFVLHFSQEMACVVADWLNNNLSKI